MHNLVKKDVMTVLERKMIKFYENPTNHSLSEPEPCMYTVSEIKAKLPAIIKELEEGKGIPHEAIKRKIVI